MSPAEMRARADWWESQMQTGSRRVMHVDIAMARAAADVVESAKVIAECVTPDRSDYIALDEALERLEAIKP